MCDYPGRPNDSALLCRRCNKPGRIFVEGYYAGLCRDCITKILNGTANPDYANKAQERK